MEPPVADIKNSAIFLDFDGTLVDFAKAPDAVTVPADLKALLSKLNIKLNGALALITGRSLASLDGLLGNSELLAAGCHGAEWRAAIGDYQTVSAELAPMQLLRPSLLTFVADHDLLLEDKHYSMALHFRDKPELEGSIDAWLAANLSDAAELRVINGKCVREIQLTGINKGLAVERFMKYRPFANRIPVYLGDDRTDEDAFERVNYHQGTSIKVGEGETIAAYRLADYEEVSRWLKRLLQNA